MNIKDLNTNKLRDDINEMEKKFDVSSYINQSEASKYLSDLPGVKDIISAIEGIVGEVSAFLNKILDMLNQLLAWLDLNKILSALGLDKLLEFIFNLTNDGLLGFGLPLDLRNLLLNLFKNSCIDMNSDSPYGNDNIDSFALSAFLIALTCANLDNTFSTTLNLFKNNDKLTKKRNTLENKKYEYSIAKDIPEYTTNDNGDIEETIDNSKLQPLLEEISVLEEDIYNQELGIDILFSRTIPKVFTSLNKQAVSNPIRITNMVNDIASTNAGFIYGNTNIGIGKSIFNIIDNGIETVSEDNIETGNKINVIDNSPFFDNNRIVELPISDEAFDTFKKSVTILDHNYVHAPRNTHINPVLRGMNRRALRNKPIAVLAPSEDIQKIKEAI